ncbi:hypothetical protein B0H10DRAFT_1953135 [Mycena sp. CBHHK59/15]|nr:hypothetical protein B0H10DRAFT_1953135 [Mycena sp. CBHHK59/15]
MSQHNPPSNAVAHYERVPHPLSNPSVNVQFDSWSRMESNCFFSFTPLFPTTLAIMRLLKDFLTITHHMTPAGPLVLPVQRTSSISGSKVHRVRKSRCPLESWELLFRLGKHSDYSLTHPTSRLNSVKVWHFMQSVLVCYIPPPCSSQMGLRVLHFTRLLKYFGGDLTFCGRKRRSSRNFRVFNQVGAAPESAGDWSAINAGAAGILEFSIKSARHRKVPVIGQQSRTQQNKPKSERVSVLDGTGSAEGNHCSNTAWGHAVHKQWRSSMRGCAGKDNAE